MTGSSGLTILMAQVRQVDMGRWTKVETNGPGGHATVELQPEKVGLSLDTFPR